MSLPHDSLGRTSFSQGIATLNKFLYSLSKLGRADYVNDNDKKYKNRGLRGFYFEINHV